MVWIESVRDALRHRIPPSLLAAICVCILAGILVAGLWPFHSPKNEVTWSTPGNGLLFGKHGSIVAATPIAVNGPRGEKSCSLEIWLAPHRLDSAGTVLALYWPASNTTSFAVSQWRGGLVLERERQGKRIKSAMYVPGVFRSLMPVVVTMSFGETGTSVYANGKLLKRAPNFIVVGRDLTGEFVMGSNPPATFNWLGQVKGLAVYDHDLSVAEVSQNFADWINGALPVPTKSEGVVARFLFNEGKGSLAANQVDGGPSLVIPARFFALHKLFLERPWDEFQNGWHYWKDVGVNIAGFIPFGFFFNAYFSTVRKIRQATWLTIALGFAVSVTIEVSQAFLPTRDSGMTDIITNTSGTVLGAMLYTYLMRTQPISGYDLPAPERRP